MQFWINGVDAARADGTMRDSFVHLQPIGGQMIDELFPDDTNGNIYKKRSANPNRDEKRWGVHFEDDVVFAGRLRGFVLPGLPGGLLLVKGQPEAALQVLGRIDADDTREQEARQALAERCEAALAAEE